MRSTLHERDEPDPHLRLFAKLLQRKGELHEDECLSEHEMTKKVHPVPGKGKQESFAAWVKWVGNPPADGCDVILPDAFLSTIGIRAVSLTSWSGLSYQVGGFGYEPVDAKLTRVAAKPGHVLQLCFYADAINHLHRPRSRAHAHPPGLLGIGSL